MHRALGRKDLVEDVFNRVMNALPRLVWMPRPGRPINFLDQHGCKDTKLALAVACGSRWHATCPRDDLPVWPEHSRCALAQGHPHEMVAPLRCFDGQHRRVLVALPPMPGDRPQAIRWQISSPDIEERKQARRRCVCVRSAFHRSSTAFPRVAGSKYAFHFLFAMHHPMVEPGLRILAILNRQPRRTRCAPRNP
jgi:hypothetical protein